MTSVDQDNKDNIKIEVDEDIKPSKNGNVAFPHEHKYAHIKNKIVRKQQYQKAKKEKQKVNIAFYNWHVVFFFCQFIHER